MKKFIKIFNSIEYVLACSLFVICCLIVLLQLLSRDIFGQSLLFTEEVARFSYIWIVYLCISLGEQNREHFFVDIFVQWVKGRANLVVYAIEYLIGCLVFGYLFYWSIKFVKFEEVILSPALEISMTVVASAVVVGIGLALVRRSIKLIKTIIDLVNYSKNKGKVVEN